MNAPARAAAAGSNRPALVTAAGLSKDFAHLLEAAAGLEARCDKEAPTVIEDDEDLGVVNALVVDLRKALKGIDAKREDEKRPFLDACSILQSWFAGLKQRLENSQAVLEARGKVYLDKKAARERARLAENERLEREAAVRRQREADEAAKASKPVEAAVATAQAQAATVRADEAAEQKAAKPADLARTRTSAGTATLKRVWCHQVIDWDKVDLEKLRPFIRRDEIDKAIAAYVKAGNRELSGVRIYEDTEANFR